MQETPPNDPQSPSGDQKTTDVKRKPKLGIALGSGVAKGFAHIGVLRALKRHGLEPDIIAGTSIGAVVGGAYCVGKMDSLEAWGHSLSRFRMMSYLDFRVRSGGLIGGKKLFELMERNFGQVEIQDLPKPFIAVSSDMTTGHEIWMRRGRLIDAVRASFSVPGIFPPVFWDNRWLVDGALVNPIPISPCRALGAQMVIAINLNGDFIGRARRPGQSIPTVSGFDILSEENQNTISKMEINRSQMTKKFFSREQNAPSLFGVLMSSMNISQDRLARSRMAGDPPDVMISPRVGHIGITEFDRVEEMIALGEDAVEKALPYIMDTYSILIDDPMSQHDTGDIAD